LMLGRSPFYECCVISAGRQVVHYSELDHFFSS
jgi:hypothetical protein